MILTAELEEANLESHVAQRVKNLPVLQEMQETQVRSLGQEDPRVRKTPGSGRPPGQEDPRARKTPGSGRSPGQEDPRVRKIPGPGRSLGQEDPWSGA